MQLKQCIRTIKNNLEEQCYIIIGFSYQFASTETAGSVGPSPL